MFADEDLQAECTGRRPAAAGRAEFRCVRSTLNFTAWALHASCWHGSFLELGTVDSLQGDLPSRAACPAAYCDSGRARESGDAHHDMNAM